MALNETFSSGSLLLQLAVRLRACASRVLRHAAYSQFHDEKPRRESENVVPDRPTCCTGRDYDPARCEVHLGQESYCAPTSPGGVGHSDPGSHSHVCHEAAVHAPSIREGKGVRLLQGDMEVGNGRVYWDGENQRKFYENKMCKLPPTRICAESTPCSRMKVPSEPQW